MVREIGTAARKELERELGAKVFLDLQVRVRERWRRDEGLLDRLGIDVVGRVVLGASSHCAKPMTVAPMEPDSTSAASCPA